MTRSKEDGASECVCVPKLVMQTDLEKKTKKTKKPRFSLNVTDGAQRFWSRFNRMWVFEKVLLNAMIKNEEVA